ncbi:hypothetical protein ACH4VR_29740 [Streptomyces sp. NPDC020883]|uniref:hypothetical protein n=1 Tax=Streptomyces sp. NPDC020883 TaxID=3365099 RepID=UPI00378EF3C3
MSSMPGLPLALYLFSTFTVLVAVATTARAALNTKACSPQAPQLRQQAVMHWAGAVIVTVVTTVARARLEASGGAGGRREEVSVPWRGVAWVGGGVLVAAGLAAAVAIILAAWRRRRARVQKVQRAREVQQGRAQVVAARHDGVLEEYGAVLGDFVAALEWPALFDSSFPSTERFDRARIDADDARIALRLDADDDELLQRYHQAVMELETAWRGAKDHARRVGTSHLEPVTARRLATAVDLVAVVRGEASDHEKALAYERIRLIRRQVGRAVRIPQQAECAIERLARPALTAAARSDRAALADAVSKSTPRR